ncbi:MAG TPA: peptide chain release factor N(5)-glutamine methyltransferase, partial [Thermomicrobiales bacterium]|nr:peptide chain release factor N(5)-glutamine methyltransferase [Thermomicrobiales bacterium]
DREAVEIIATDVSEGALEVAATNRGRLGLDDRVALVRTHVLHGLTGPFDLILANLPYLRDDQRHPSTASEPDGALFAGHDGFDLYREMFKQVPVVLAPDGRVIAEIDPSQAGFGGGLAARVTGLPVEIARDSSGRDRFLIVGSRA